MPLELHTSETFLKEVLGTVKYFLKKHMHMTKTHKAWVLSIIGYPIQVLQIQNSAFSWTNTPHPKQWCYSIQTLSQWHLILYSRTKFPRSWIYTNKKNTRNGNIYTLLADLWTQVQNIARLYDSAGDGFKDVSCSLRKQFVASPQNSHISTTSSFDPFR